MDHKASLKVSMGKQIKRKRNELLLLVEKNGLNDSKVLKCSQELDLLIYQVQLIHRGKTRTDIFACQNYREWGMNNGSVEHGEESVC
jgi:hypothetical protein